MVTSAQLISLHLVRDNLNTSFHNKVVLNFQIIQAIFFHVQREQLTEVILRLLGAWTDPLSQLSWSMSQDQNQDFNDYSSNKALEMSDIVRELRDGVAKIAEKVRIHLWLQSLWIGFVLLSNIDCVYDNIWICLVICRK